ncbi:MAG: hypothetical protein D6710_12280, partial [Nitrospirae bacterium]
GNVLLKAPRRFGKSSVMYNLYERPRDGFIVVFQDTEGINDPADFITTLLSSIRQHESIGDRFKKAIKDIVKSAASWLEEVEIAEFRLKLKEHIKDKWQEKGEELLRVVGKLDVKIVFIVDELPVLIQRITENHKKRVVKDFLHWFRQLRQIPEVGNVRWVAGGSIGIEHVLKQVGAGTKTINDFEIIKIGAFSEDDARAYMRALLKNEGHLLRISGEVIDRVLELVGAPVPYFIQIVLKESIHEMRRQGKKTLSKDMVERAYRHGALGPASRTYFEHYFSRLSEYYDERKESIAKRLILEVAKKGEVKKKELFKLFKMQSGGKLRDEVFSYLMTDIENDFYVTYDPENDTYRFSTNILKDWWLRYYDLVED